MNALKDLYIELFKEFSKHSEELIDEFRVVLYGKTSYPTPNQNLHRYYNLHQFNSRIVFFFDAELFSGIVRRKITKYKSTRKIFDYIINNNLSPFNNVSYEEDLNRELSVTKNLIAYFISKIFEISHFARIFEISHSGGDIIENTFNEVFTELEQFFLNDKFRYKILINLHGPLGEVTNITLNGIAIKKAGYEISRLFCYYYSDAEYTELEMIENDYYIEIEREITKKNWQRQLAEEKSVIEKVFNCLLLSNPGNIELGKSLRMSKAWPLIRTNVMNISKIPNKYSGRNLFRYEFNAQSIKSIQDNYGLLKDVNYTKIDDKIKNSFERLKKAKSTFKIEDKIVELALGIEYLINTKDFEVTLQLRCKIMKILYPSNQDENIFKQLGDFFSLRGDVMHGNKRVKSLSRNISLIQVIEKIILDVLLRYILLNQKYSFEKINVALDKTLYLSKTVEEILNW